MTRKFNRERLRAFRLRRKENALGLSVLTALSAVCCVIAALRGFRRTDVLVIVTVLLMLLCAIQSLRMKGSYRTMRAFRGVRRRKREE